MFFKCKQQVEVKPGREWEGGRTGSSMQEQTEVAWTGPLSVRKRLESENVGVALGGAMEYAPSDLNWHWPDFSRFDLKYRKP